MTAKVHVILVHHPVLSRDGGIVTSAITNLDVHDISRTARTYGASSFTLVHPVEAQRDLVRRIVHHWTFESSAQRIPTRKEALEIVRVSSSLEEAYANLGGREHLVLWGTTASASGTRLAFAAAREIGAKSERDVVLLFGTSWGLTPETLDSCDAVLEPVQGTGRYNHLSVRSAVAIVMDRIWGGAINPS